MILENRKWYKLDGANSAQIEMLVSSVGFEIPTLYIDLLQYSNGGEGPLEVQPYNLVLYPISDVIDRDFRKAYESIFPGYFVIGGDGGGEYIALEISTERVVALDSVNSDLSESCLEISTGFEQFVKLIGVDSDSA